MPKQSKKMLKLNTSSTPFPKNVTKMVVKANKVNPGNSARRYVHPKTGRSVVVDDVTGEVLHVGGDGFKH